MDTKELIKKAQRYRAAGEIDEAHASFREAAESEDPIAEYLFAQFLRSERRPEGVQTWYQAYGRYLVRAAEHGSMAARAAVAREISKDQAAGMRAFSSRIL